MAPGRLISSSSLSLLTFLPPCWLLLLGHLSANPFLSLLNSRCWVPKAQFQGLFPMLSTITPLETSSSLYLLPIYRWPSNFYLQPGLLLSSPPVYLTICLLTISTHMPNRHLNSTCPNLSSQPSVFCSPPNSLPHPSKRQLRPSFAQGKNLEITLDTLLSLISHIWTDS